MAADCQAVISRSIELAGKFNEQVSSADDEETVATAAMHVLIPACACAAGISPAEAVQLTADAADAVFKAIFEVIRRHKAVSP